MPAHPDRRLAPRPLPAQLLNTLILWASSRAALPLLKSVSRLSNVAGTPLRALAHEIDALGPERVAAALETALAARAERCLAGLDAYRRHPYRRDAPPPPVLWSEGSTRLLDYGCRGDPPVLVVPSLINRYYVLDLLPERSFLRHLATAGLRPLVVDWDAPGHDERGFDLTRYIAGRLEAAFDASLAVAGAPLSIVGYCMGGLLALALALRRRRQVRCLALLATPWDFHAGGAARAHVLGTTADWLAISCAAPGVVPVDVLQGLFLLIDPFAAERKFVRFAGLDGETAAARAFVALEDWVNDGVPLAWPAARDCLSGWYGGNEPGRGLWRVAGRAVMPGALRRPALVVVPGSDRIVPPASAEPLAAALGAATVLRPALGHVGMMSAARAPALLWTPFTEWLLAQLPTARHGSRRLDRGRPLAHL